MAHGPASAPGSVGACHTCTASFKTQLRVPGACKGKHGVVPSSLPSCMIAYAPPGRGPCTAHTQPQQLNGLVSAGRTSVENARPTRSGARPGPGCLAGLRRSTDGHNSCRSRAGEVPALCLSRCWAEAECWHTCTLTRLICQGWGVLPGMHFAAGPEKRLSPLPSTHTHTDTPTPTH